MTKCKTCKKNACFGKQGSKLAEYCKTHAPAGYVDIAHKRCKHENCDTRPAFGKQGSKLAEYCKTHAPAGYVDIAHKRCKHENCDTRPWYSYAGYAPEYCAKHKKHRMVANPLSKQKEQTKKCSYCEHDIHYNEEFCSSCKTYIKEKTTVKTKQKELTIKTLLDENEIKFLHDSVVVDGCSKKRPDFLIITNWGNIIIEVDEFQHRRNNYPCECETTRMKQIYTDLGSEYLLFIRYNPDNYATSDNKPWPSNKRHEYLIKLINGYLPNRPTDNISVVYLFYDHFTNSNEKFIGGVEPDKIEYVHDK